MNYNLDVKIKIKDNIESILFGMFAYSLGGTVWLLTKLDYIFIPFIATFILLVIFTWKQPWSDWIWLIMFEIGSMYSIYFVLGEKTEFWFGLIYNPWLGTAFLAVITGWCLNKITRHKSLIGTTNIPNKYFNSKFLILSAILLFGSNVLSLIILLMDTLVHHQLIPAYFRQDEGTILLFIGGLAGFFIAPIGLLLTIIALLPTRIMPIIHAKTA